ncbi:MAG: alkaline phosphatase family protein, partial [Thermodesulfobacteriota bacterium]|nr:alkaline phosphatase family protein [Thermodesulfobacteriota bacterium]
MKLLNNLFSRRKRIVVIGLDGVPFSFVNKLVKNGELTNFNKLINEGDIKRMNSVYPAVSSVAWSSFMTGKNPGGHNIYGFIDRPEGSHELYIPNGNYLKSKTIFEIVGEDKKRVLSMNVPVTYPPRTINGTLIAGFLSPSIDKATYPERVSVLLKKMGYRIDADPWKGREKDKSAFLEDIFITFKKRVEAFFYLWENDDWDYLHLHIMETDRINHFLWEHWERNLKYAQEFLKFYKEIDNFLGEVRQRISEDTEFIVLSDHGFCEVEKEIYLNYSLIEKGWLVLKNDNSKSLKDIHKESKAYSLIPGRIYINLKGRELEGNVKMGKEYEDIREGIIEDLNNLKEPE